MKALKKLILLMILTGVLTGIILGVFPSDDFNIDISWNSDSFYNDEKTTDYFFDEDDTLLEVHFIDVGQGDCTLIKYGEHAMLIDAGGNNKGTAVQLYLTKQGVEKLDYIIGTHPDADHIGGLDVIITKFDCETIMMPEIEKDTKTYKEVIDAMKYKNYVNSPPFAGTVFPLGKAEFTVVAPVNYGYGDNTNNYSIGILLEYGETGFLFTGDAESAAEADMLTEGIDLSADVFKVAHHGSISSNTEEFLDAVDPSFAVISCGEGNSYGHPHAEVLSNLENRDITVFRTDMQGTVIALSDGKKITWK